MFKNKNVYDMKMRTIRVGSITLVVT